MNININLFQTSIFKPIPYIFQNLYSNLGSKVKYIFKVQINSRYAISQTLLFFKSVWTLIPTIKFTCDRTIPFYFLPVNHFFFNMTIFMDLYGRQKKMELLQNKVNGINKKYRVYFRSPTSDFPLDAGPGPALNRLSHELTQILKHSRLSLSDL